jgi:hypothetical protein
VCELQSGSLFMDIRPCVDTAHHTSHHAGTPDLSWFSSPRGGGRTTRRVHQPHDLTTSYRTSHAAAGECAPPPGTKGRFLYDRLPLSKCPTSRGGATYRVYAPSLCRTTPCVCCVGLELGTWLTLRAELAVGCWRGRPRPCAGSGWHAARLGCASAQSHGAYDRGIAGGACGRRRTGTVETR